MPNNTNQIIDAWFQNLVHGTVIQRDEALYNAMYAGKEELKKLLTPSENKKTTKEENV